MLAIWIMTAALADEVRGAVGGQLETEGHGILDLGYKRGPLSVQVFTDTLDIHVQDSNDLGRWSVGLRGATFAAGMWITPWTDGAPDLTRAQRASYFGPDAEVQRYLPGGLWVGGSAFLRPHWFTPLADSTLQVPATQWLRADATAGLWRAEGAVQARLAVGVDVTDPGWTSPHVFAQARLDPHDRLYFGAGGVVLSPTLDLHGGLAQAQDDITATRLGGLTPYGVPFAGAAWAEVWAEDYGVARLGGRLTVRTLTVTAGVDVGAWTRPVTAPGVVPVDAEVGLSAGLRWAWRDWFAEGAVGYSPTWDRPDGVWAVPVYLLVGSAWTWPGKHRDTITVE